MNKDRLWIIGAGAVLVIVALAGWSLGISPLVDQASAANAQVTSMTAANVASQARLARLKTQYTNIDQFRTDLAALRTSIPSDASLAAFLKEINALCDEHNVQLTSVSLADATLYVNPNTPAEATGAAAGSTATPTPAPTPTASATPVTPVTPGSSSGDFVLLPVTISYTGSFADVMAFTGGVQTGPRLFVSSSFNITKQASLGDGKSYQATMIGTVYALKGVTPDSEVITDPVGIIAPEPTDTATPDPSGTPTPDPSETPIPTDTPAP